MHKSSTEIENMSKIRSLNVKICWRATIFLSLIYIMLSPSSIMLLRVLHKSMLKFMCRDLKHTTFYRTLAQLLNANDQSVSTTISILNYTHLTFRT